MKKICLLLSTLSVLLSSQVGAQDKMTFGRFQSRAIFTQAKTCSAPIVIMVPGSGANGPEEMMPGSLTGDGKDHSLFGEFTEGLTRNGMVSTLAIGKPGIDFFKSWNANDKFYNKNMYVNLSWQDMINNVADAVEFASKLPCVDSNNIIIFGHSEGTQVAIDFANQFPDKAKSLVLVGFSGVGLSTTVEWQLFHRDIDDWLAPDVDFNHSGYITKEQASHWPEFKWNWKPGQDKVTFPEIEAAERIDPGSVKVYQQAVAAKVWQGVFYRPPIYTEASNLKQNIFVFTGELDVQTRPEEAMALKGACDLKHKRNCHVQIVPGLGHGMSAPKGPRKQKLLDATLGPVDPSFQGILSQLAKRLSWEK